MPRPPHNRTRLTTARELIQARHKLEVYCPRCNVWRHMELARMVMEGRGDECLIGRGWVCRGCGGVGQAQLQPPVPGGPGYEPGNKYLSDMQH